jgi:hypothetical protein
MVESHRIDRGFTSSELQALIFERMVPVPFAHKALKRFARRDTHQCASRKLLSVWRQCRPELASYALALSTGSSPAIATWFLPFFLAK